MVPYLFPPEESLLGLLRLLREQHWFGQIVGPHGSGKSTLLASLLPEVARQAGKVLVLRLTTHRRSVPAELRRVIRSNRAAEGARVIIIDGYEQLPAWRRFWLQLRCLRKGCGLLVSAHRPLQGMPVLYRTRVSPEIAARVVGHLLRDDLSVVIDDLKEKANALLVSHQNNLREVLWDLYDWYEERNWSRPGAKSCRR
jgi:hypothetical protein